MIRRMTQQQRSVYRALRELGGELVVSPDDARPLHALKRRGLVRFGRDANGVKVARLRANRATRRRTRRMKATDSMYAALRDGHYIPPIEGSI